MDYFFDLASKQDILVFVPLNVHNHWVLAVIQHFSDDNHTVLTYYDSMRRDAKRYERGFPKIV